MRGVARWTAPVAVAAALLLAPAAGAAIGVGATVCTIALRAPTGDFRCAVAMTGGWLALDGSPTFTAGVPGGQSARFAYDDAGRLVRADVGERATSYRYDSRGRVVALADSIGEPVEYSYDDLGRLIAAGDARFAYTDVGLQSAAWRDGTIVTYRYDARGAVIYAHEGAGDGYFGYDVRGRITNARTTSETVQYDYDGNRLVRRTQDGTVAGYSYDDRGDLLRSSDSRGNVAAYGYDTDGSLRTVQRAGDATRFSYDRAGRLAAISLADGGVTAFGYDDSGLLSHIVAAVDDEVVVAFEEGDADQPYVVGSLWDAAAGAGITLRGRIVACADCP